MEARTSPTALRRATRPAASSPRSIRRAGRRRRSPRRADRRPACAATRCSAACSWSLTSLALSGAFLLTIELSSRPLVLTWAALVGVPTLLRRREALRALRPRRGAAAQDDARRGAEAVPASRRSARSSPGSRAACSWRATLDRQRGADPVAVLADAAAPAPLRSPRVPRARDRSRRALPVHRRRDVGATIRSKLDRPRGVKARARRPPRPRQGRRPGRPTRSRSRAWRRSATSRRRSTCTARSSRRAAPTPARCSTCAHAQGGRRARQRAAAAARGGRLLGRVRRPPRRDRDGRAPLRPDAAPRPRSSASST